MIIIMDPNNTPPLQPQQPEQFNANEYDFILKSGAPAKKSFLIGGSQTKTIIAFLSIVIILVIFAVIGFSMLNSNDSTTEPLVKITQQQNEIIRVANSSTGKAKSQKAIQLATVSNITITTDQKALIAYLAKQKRKVSPKELILSKSKKTDDILTTANNNGRYDDAFLQIMNDLLVDYQKSLKASKNNVGKNGQEILSKSFDNVTLILSSNSTTQ